MYDDVLLELVRDRIEERVNAAVEAAVDEARRKTLEEVRQEARRASLTRSILSLMDALGLSPERAMSVLGIPEDEWPAYRALVDERSRVAADAAPVGGSEGWRACTTTS